MQPHDLTWTANHIITFDGDTLLTYDGETEAPSWMKTLRGRVTAIAGAGDLLIVATDGAITGFHADRGTVRWTASVDGAAHSLAVGPGKWAAAIDDTVVEGVAGSVEATYPASGVEVVAYNPAGDLAVGTAQGLSVVTADGVVQAGLADISGVCAAPDGGWYVTAGCKLFHLDAALDTLGGAQMSDTAFSTPVTSPSGRFVAVRVDADYVAIYATDGLKQAGWVAYKAREIGGICFSKGDWIAVAVGEGHANKMHLGAGLICRTDEHPGRARGSWMLSYKAEDALWPEVGADERAGIEPARDPGAVAAPGATAAGNPMATVLGLVVAAVVGVAVYFVMQ